MTEIIRKAAEETCEEELSALSAADKHDKPQGWHLSPKMVETFILGSQDRFQSPAGREVSIVPKFVGSRRLVQVAIATLMSDRALLLIGEPGTAKTWLAEHLCAAVSGTSDLLIQGSSGITEEQLKYSWNYALLLAEGPSDRSLIRSPIYTGMEEGKLVRVEELTRCASEVQDVLISLLSEKTLHVSETGEVIRAHRGFNVIATANTRDRGINEMSSALKRRFNFVVLPVLSDLAEEVALVQRRVDEMLQDYEVPAKAPKEVIVILVTAFQELRRGRTLDNKTAVKSPSAVLSTAETVSVLFNAGIMASHFGTREVTPPELAQSLVGTVLKESRDDLDPLREYAALVANKRGSEWAAFGREIQRTIALHKEVR